jgi:alpha-N-acetylglucosamine transferase
MNSKMAYVWLLMKGDSYMPGILVSAHSVKLTKSALDLVVMITEDVSDAAIKIMHSFGIITYKIPYIRFKCADILTDKQKRYYSAWMNDSFTKWNCLKLTKYKKILLLDADAIVLTNIDHLFNLQAPAAPFNTQYSILYQRISKYGAPVDPEYVKFLLGPHGQMRRGNRKFITLTASTVLIEPNLEHFKRFVEEIKKLEKGAGFGFPSNSSMYDEQSISYFYSIILKKTWTNIDEKYNLMGWKSIITPYVLHYIATKPWKITEKELREWPDMIYFYKILADLLNNKLSKNIYLKPLIKLAKLAEKM